MRLTVAWPRNSGQYLVGPATPEIGHQPAVAERGEGRAGGRLTADHLGEALTHRAGPRINLSADLHGTILACPR